MQVISCILTLHNSETNHENRLSISGGDENVVETFFVVHFEFVGVSSAKAFDISCQTAHGEISVLD